MAITNSPPPSRQNHYVPEWYQRGFSLNGSFNFFLDLSPPQRRPDGSPIHVIPRRRSPKSCFWELDLYTTRFGELVNDQIETVLFQGIDDMGANAIRAFISADPANMHEHYEAFFSYLGAQKLRTPKGLDWIRSRYPALSQVELMIELQHLRNLYGTLWVEAVREIVSAEDSEVKFLVTDHPVTTFNAAWPLDLSRSADLNDAPVALNGTQTVFALDANHCLILTHLPYAKAHHDVPLTTKRENARHFASTLTRTDALIHSRRLTSDEVIAINTLLKARARRYIAAAESDWLYPEEQGVVDRERVAQVLLPPQNELWHFSGEIYVGHKDGHVDYRDAFGRTSNAHQFLAKPLPKTPPSANDACPCGSGLTFGSCCALLPAWERPAWNIRSLRERNLIFIGAVRDILGLEADRVWDDVRETLSDEQVARIYNVVQALWPENTDLGDLLPRPNKNVARAVYMGLSDPRTVMSSVVSLVPLFDQLLVVDPFLNPANLRTEYSPIQSPSNHKQQLLKNVMFLLTIEPLVWAGKVLLFPDPGDMAPAFQRAMWEMAEARTSNDGQQKQKLEELHWLGNDDFERSLSQLPDDALRSIAKKSSPNFSDDQLNAFVVGMRERQRNDPLALLQSLPAGEDGAQFTVLRSVNLEVALYIAQLTGSLIVTDIKALWTHLHMHTRAADSDALPTPGTHEEPATFRAYLNPIDALAVSEMPESAEARATLLKIREAVAGHEFSDRADELMSELRQRLRQIPTLTDANATSPEAAGEITLELSSPKKGFESATAQRLVVSFGRDSAPVSVGLAIFRASQVSAADGTAKDSKM